MTTLADVKIITFNNFSDDRGNLAVAEELKDVPFSIRRVFWLYGVPKGRGRGGHGHISCQQLLVTVAGRLEVYVSDGTESKTFILDNPSQGLLIPVGIWAEEREFSQGAVCMVLTDQPFDADDYLGPYEEFLEYRLSAAGK